MQDNSSGKSMFKEEAMKAILKSMAEEGSSNQLLALFILSNIGGTYTWTGEPYTVAWLVKKAGLTSLHHRNMIRDFDWLDQSLQVLCEKYHYNPLYNKIFFSFSFCL